MAAPAKVGGKYPEGTLFVESRRPLPVVTFLEGQAPSVDIPKDTCIKRMEISAVGKFRVTYASGSPIADAAGFCGRLINHIDVNINGNDTVKAVDPYMMKKQQQLLESIMDERAFSTGASNPTTLIAATETPSGAPFTFPATTQYVTLNECFTLYFEMPWAYGQGTRSTLLYTKNVSSAQLTFNFATLSQLQRSETSQAAVTYDDFDIKFTVNLVENRWENESINGYQFLYFKETLKREQFSGEQRSRIVKLPRGGILTGLMFLARNGDANRSLSDTIIRELRVRLDTSNISHQISYVNLKRSNRARFGVNAARSSGIDSLQGFAYLPMISNGDIMSGLPTLNYQEIDLEIDTAPSSGTDAGTYTNPAELTIMTQEVVKPSPRG